MTTKPNRRLPASTISMSQEMWAKLVELGVEFYKAHEPKPAVVPGKGVVVRAIVGLFLEDLHNDPEGSANRLAAALASAEYEK